MHSTLAKIIFFLLLVNTCFANQSDSIIFKQRIGRYGIRVKELFKFENSIGYVYLKEDSVTFIASVHHKYDFSVSYHDIITVYATSPIKPLPFVFKVINIETKNELLKIGGAPKAKYLIDLIRQQVKKCNSSP